MTTPLPSWQPDLFDRSVTLERITTVAFTPMPVRLRNELITQTYGDIAEAMAQVLGHENATWSNLGAWASASVGRFLSLPIPVVGNAMSRPLADGNRDVFADIGRAHVDFLDTVGRAHMGGEPIGPAWKECVRRLNGYRVETPGNAAGDNFALWDTLTDNATRPGGQPTNRLLRLGFEAYARSLRLEGDEKATAVLLGNVLLALHEQRRLSIAISVGFRSWVRTLTSLPHPLRTQQAWATTVPSNWHIAIENRWIKLATKHLVGIETPGQKIRVSKAVPVGDRPVTFDRIELDRPTGLSPDMTDIEKLSQIYAALDVDGQPAICWNDQVQRMSYITSLFEQHQRSDRWFSEAGVVARPVRWSRFESTLNKHANSGAEPPRATDSVSGPLDDGFLDSLRSEPSHPELTDAATLTFDVIRDRRLRRTLMKEIEADSAERLSAIAGPEGLLSPDVCGKARNLYQQWSVAMLMGLLFRSLPHDYAAARGVKVLGAISSLGTDSLRRAGETAHFVRDLMDSDDGWQQHTMQPHGEAFASVVGVRCLHAIVSGHLLDDDWDTESLGVPINQEDVLGTALSFAVPPLEMMADLGIDVTTELKDAYTSFWCGIGHLLGAPLEAVTTLDSTGARVALTYEQGQDVMAAIRRRHHARSLDGVVLTEALLAGVGDGFPRGFGWMSHGMMNALGDRTVTTMLLAHMGPGRRRAAIVAWSLRLGLGSKFTGAPSRWLVQKIGTRWLEPFMTLGERRPYRHPGRYMVTPGQVGNTNVEVWPFGC